MGRLKTTALIAGALAVGVGGGIAGADALGGDDDQTIAPITVPAANSASQATQAPRVVVDDGVPTRDAKAVAQAAADHVKGRALSVDIDDGRYEVEVQRPDGAIVEVLLDGQNIIAVDQGDGDDTID